jgi:hypothetical protein
MRAFKVISDEVLQGRMKPDPEKYRDFIERYAFTSTELQLSVSFKPSERQGDIFSLRNSA